VAAIFSPIFIEAKYRLKMMLNHLIYYTDGMTPQDVSIVLQNMIKAKYFYENDLKK